MDRGGQTSITMKRLLLLPLVLILALSACQNPINVYEKQLTYRGLATFDSLVTTRPAEWAVSIESSTHPMDSAEVFRLTEDYWDNGGQDPAHFEGQVEFEARYLEGNIYELVRAGRLNDTVYLISPFEDSAQYAFLALIPAFVRRREDVENCDIEEW